jgi:hypothetical protein
MVSRSPWSSAVGVTRTSSYQSRSLRGGMLSHQTRDAAEEHDERQQPAQRGRTRRRAAIARNGEERGEEARALAATPAPSNHRAAAPHAMSTAKSGADRMPSATPISSGP